MSILLPHLDETTALSDLLAGMQQERAGMITSLLQTLRGRGVVTKGFGPTSSGLTEAAAFENQRMLVNDLGGNSAGFDRVLTSQVTVLGSTRASWPS
ncbi:hypothetical protein [uncultured Friedmanniella sp.]|uniref:hypothetical protein n=1 Tax=uncultured Friedmanniella sp. TaxID=335381 RepID=UPI0035CC35CF